MGGGDKNGPYVIMYGFFFDTNLLFNVYIGSIDVLKGPGGLHWVAVTKTGSLLVRIRYVAAMEEFKQALLDTGCDGFEEQ